jgi:eukaryotic-like serine/threonine-protein kinase
MHPQQVGPYQIVSRLGHGGMGAVYEAVEPRSGKAVAIKVLAAHLADDAGVRSRFETEIATLKSLQHPGIVQLLAYGEDDGQPYFAMELVRGQALDKLLRGGRHFTWRETVTVAAAVTRALKAAHDSGAIHRDLKPANLLVPEKGTLADIKLADFGIAKFFGASGHTAAGNVVGTAEYMAPEQAAGKPVDARADIYSLGLVMFAMLTGKPPFRAGHYTEVMRMQQTTTPPRLTTLLPDLPEPVDRLIQKMLAKNPADRPASALALGRLLEAVEAAITAELSAAKPVVVAPAPDPNLTARGVSADDATLEVTTDQPAAPADARLLAATQGATPPPPAADPTKRDRGTKQPTETDAANTQVGPVRRSRHVSVEREKVIVAAREKRAHRRELWVQAASVVGLAAVLLVGGYLLLRPLTADELRARIEETIATTPERLDGLKDAEREIDEFLRRFADDPRAEEVGALKQRILVDRLEKRAALRKRRDKPPYLRIERDYREALEPDDSLEQLTRLEAILVANPKTLATPVGLPADDDDLQANLDLWKALVTVKIDQMKQLASADQRAEQLDTQRRKP